MEEVSNEVFSLELLKKKIKEEKRTGMVDLSHQGLTRLPEEVLALKGVKIMVCDFNNFDILPKHFAVKFSATLTRLSLHNNQLSNLPSEFGQLLKLRNLELSYNRLKVLPLALAQLTSLEELIIQWNMISSLNPDVLNKLKNLQNLDLHGNFIKILPSEIGELTSLIGLNLRNNRIRKLPSALSKLKKLSSFNLIENEITTLPHEFGKIDSLTTLSIWNNRLSFLPMELGELRNLTLVDLASNRLSRLLAAPKKLKKGSRVDKGSAIDGSSGTNNNTNDSINKIKGKMRWGGVKRIILSRNKLRELPMTVCRGAKNLCLLVASNNMISTLPKEIGRLKLLDTIDFSYNSIKDLPVEMRMLEHLRVLNMGNNKLEYDESWETIFEHLTLLEEIHLGSNKITHIPKSIGHAKGLLYLNVFDNEISSLPKSLKKIKAFVTPNSFPQNSLGPMLVISYNKFTEFPSILLRLKGLTELHFAGNSLSSIPSDISKMQELQFISFGCNKAHQLTIPESIVQLPKLTRLYLRGSSLASPLPSSFVKLTTQLLELDISPDQALPLPQNAGVTGNAVELVRAGYPLQITSTHVSKCHRFDVGCAKMIGIGIKNEDTLAVKCESAFRGKSDEQYFAIFDGHGGKSTSEVAASKFHEFLVKNLDMDDSDPVSALERTFVELNEHIYFHNLADKSGSTGVVALIVKQTLYVANVGDSRAVYYDGKLKTVRRLSVDHKPEIPKEAKRIRQIGGMVRADQMGAKQYRVCRSFPGGGFGGIAVSRALGDFAFSPYIHSNPYVASVPLHVSGSTIAGSGEESYLILGCDGVWDVLEDEDSVRIVARERDDMMKAAVRLRDAAYLNRSGDDTTVIVVRLG